MGRYVLRWPGHCVFWKKLIDLHLLDAKPVEVDGVPVNRRHFLQAVIEPHIQYQENERDIVIVRLDVSGLKDGKRKRIVHQIIDRRDLKTGLTAMNRTVGYTASIGAQMIANGKIEKRGILSPVNDVPFKLFKQELQKRDIFITSQVFNS